MDKASEKLALPRIRFRAGSDPFADALRERVDGYFKEQRVSRRATPRMALEAAALFGAWGTLLGLIYSNRVHGWGLLGLQVGLSVVMLVMAVGIAHDGSHKAVSASPLVNRLSTWVFDLVGVNSYLWGLDHVRSHHGGTNVPLHDSNMYLYHFVRMHPLMPYKWYHRYQHIFAFPLYSMATLSKSTFADFVAWRRPRIGAMSFADGHPLGELGYLVGMKFVVWTYALILPVLLVDDPAWRVVGGYLLGHLVGGLLLGAMFQVTHTNDSIVWPAPAGPGGEIERSHERHVLETTTSFAVDSPFWTFISGGLNIHAAHHLFPSINRIHLPEIHKIVRATAREHHVPIMEYYTITQAIRAHLRVLEVLGRSPEIDVAALNAAGLAARALAWPGQEVGSLPPRLQPAGMASRE